MATLLAPVDAKPVVRCDQCHLCQFIPTLGLSSPCRRCKVPLDYEEPKPPEPEPIVVVPHERGSLAAQLAQTFRERRLALKLSQRQLSKKLQTPRTYVSKIENEKATPTLSSLVRLAAALETDIPGLLSFGEHNRQQQVVDLLHGDEFVAAVAQYLPKLDEMQRTAILRHIRGVVAKQQRRHRAKSSWQKMSAIAG